MNLIVDIGNSSTKLAIYDEWKMIYNTRINELSCESIEKKLSGYKISKTIISSVKELPDFIIDLLTINIPYVHLLSINSNLPFKNEYETPGTLGTDRIAVVAGGCLHFKGKNLLIIDAGTAITFDFLVDTKFTGGNISPGIDLRFRALNQFTSKLPFIEKTTGYSSPGKNTSEAILAGVINGVVYEINEYIRTFIKKQKDAKVILTGGDGVFLKDMIIKGAEFKPDLLTDGLNYILEYNAK